MRINSHAYKTKASVTFSCVLAWLPIIPYGVKLKPKHIAQLQYTSQTLIKYQRNFAACSSGHKNKIFNPEWPTTMTVITQAQCSAWY